MTDAKDRLQRWSWHQSHDQATVLLNVPLDLDERDFSIHLDERYLVATIRGESAAIKGRLYGTINTLSSTWQLERSRSAARSRRRKARAPSTSAGSSDSSYAVLTDPDISSSFTPTSNSASQTDIETESEYEATDVERRLADLRLVVGTATNRRPLSQLSSPDDSHDEGSVTGEWNAVSTAQMEGRREAFAPASTTSSSRPSSPNATTEDPSLASSLTSSVNSPSRRPLRPETRLLTIHLEKNTPGIWPALIVSGVPAHIELSDDGLVSASASEISFASTSTTTATDALDEQQYNMDPTSLVGVGMMTLHDDVDLAFEYFCRAWLANQDPVAAMKLAFIYLPLHTTPQRSAIVASERSYSRYLRRIGGNIGLARLYHAVGIIYLQGLGTSLSGSTSTLSNGPSSLGLHDIGGQGNNSVLTSDVDTAQRYFRRARVLDPSVEIPEARVEKLRDELRMVMPVLDVGQSATTVKESGGLSGSKAQSGDRRRKRNDRYLDDDQDQWSALYLPGLVGAGLAIGIVGIMSASWWRSNNR
ncbi:hypothetical protein FRB97_004926 [Tulasnella sp. 331]|nr:hypothetical protein FRB97_004926 [Tulasnella sp. 331]